MAVNALRHVVESNSSEELVGSLQHEDVWQKLQDDENYWQGCIVLARLFLLAVISPYYISVGIFGLLVKKLLYVL